MIGPGTRLGRYELTDLLGAGGMGQVFRGRDVLLGRDVAVKILPPRWAADPRYLARFGEARALAALSHPRILAIYDYGTTAETAYAVTELLVGRTVADRLRDGPLAWADAVAVARATAEGLAAAHARGIVHRDIKPSNLFLGPDGVKILDFGLVAHDAPPGAEPDANAPTAQYDPALTTEGTILGTPGYMSPEQACGDPTDARTDIFALGCVLHEMLVGAGPFRRTTVAGSIAATLRDPPPALPPSVPGWLAAVVARCLAKDPADRYASIGSLVTALAPPNGGHQAASITTHAPPPAPPDPEARRLYLRARWHFDKRTETDFDAARELYREALAVDPGYAAAYAGLAELHAIQGAWGSMPPQATFPVARQLAEKALELDPRSAEAWAVLGFVRGIFGWEWAEADADLRRAIALRPDHATTVARHAYLLLLRGRFAEALAGFRAAAARDPLSISVRVNAGMALSYLGRHDEAQTELQAALTLNPNSPSGHHCAGLVRQRMGDLPRAVAAHERAVELSGDLPGDLSGLGHALAAAGRTADAEAVLARLAAAATRRYVPPFFFALGHLALGRADEGFRWLDAALAERDYYLVNSRVDWRLDPYRSDERFARVIAAVHGPDDPADVATSLLPSSPRD